MVNMLTLVSETNEYQADPLVAIKEIGQSCSAEFGFPASLYLILKYWDSFEDALPTRWVNGLNHKKRIEDALNAFS